MLDIIIGVVLAIGLTRGFFTGVVRQVTSLVGLIVAFIAALQLMRPVGVLMENVLGVSPRVGTIIGFILVFAAVQIVVFVITKLTEGLLKVLHLSVLNRLAGGVLGGLKAALLLSVLFLVAGQIGLPKPETQRTSVLYEPVSSVLPAAWNYLAERIPQVETVGRKFGATSTEADSGR